MKKTLAAVALAMLAVTAFAGSYGFGGGGDTDSSPCNGGCGGPCYQGDAGGDADLPPAIDDAKAESLVQDFVDENLKGFSVQDYEKAEVRYGSMYRFQLEDTNGNQFYILVNPVGDIKGPLLSAAKDDDTNQ